MVGLFSKKVPKRKWPDAVSHLVLALKRACSDFYPTFLSHTAIQGLAQSLGEAGQHDVAMLQLAAVASTISENGYVSDLALFLELVYIGMTGRDPEEMHAEIADHVDGRRSDDDPRASLAAWASKMAKDLSDRNDSTTLAAELVSYGALLVVQAKVSTCEAFGDHRGAEKVRSAMR